MSNVVVLDLTATARQQAAAVRRKYALERVADEVWALRRNRAARIARMRRFWIFMCVSSFIAGALVVQQVHRSFGGAPRAPAAPSTALVQEPDFTASHTKTMTDLATSTIPVATKSAAELVAPAASMSAKAVTAASSIRPPSLAASASQKLLPYPSDSKQQPELSSSSRFEAREVSLSAAIAPPPTRSIEWKVIGVPVDGVVQIQLGTDQTVRHLKIGQRLPNGAEIRAASSEFQTVETNTGRLSIKP
jgi:hypothetical protein